MISEISFVQRSALLNWLNTANVGWGTVSVINRCSERARLPVNFCGEAWSDTISLMGECEANKHNGGKWDSSEYRAPRGIGELWLR